MNSFTIFIITVFGAPSIYSFRQKTPADLVQASETNPRAWFIKKSQAFVDENDDEKLNIWFLRNYGGRIFLDGGELRDLYAEALAYFGAWRNGDATVFHHARFRFEDCCKILPTFVVAWGNS